MSEVKTNKVSSLASNNDITLDPDGTGDVVVASGHKLGIGVSSPGRFVHLEDGTDTTLHLTTSSTGSTGSDGTSLFVDGTAASLWQRENDYLRFATNNTERMRITSDGDVGVGATNPTFSSGKGVHLADTYFLGLGSGNGTRPDFQIGTTGGSTLDFRCGTGADTVDLSISTGGVFTGDFNDTSDERLKENIQDIAANQIDVVKQLRPVTFDWKATEKTSNTGFIAQEVAVLLPNDVQRSNPDDSDSTLGINSMALVATLTAALKEAIAKIETLETKVTALENA
jgi:hypothetical protein